MSEDPRDPVAGLAEGMEAAGALIESLEQEVESLRSDPGPGGSAALKAAQEGVSARADELEEKERARVEAEREVEDLRAEISSLKQQHSDEQLRLSNEHINELAEVRRSSKSNVWPTWTRPPRIPASTTSRKSSGASAKPWRPLQEEIEALKNASEHWEEQLRTSYQEQEARHAAEIESARKANAERESDLERSLTEDFERRLAEERSASDERHKAAVQNARNAAAARELELQKELPDRGREAARGARGRCARSWKSSANPLEERRKRELREVKALTERRENDLRKTHAARLAEAKESAEKRIAVLQAQREGGQQGPEARHAEETGQLRRENAERLAAEDERRKAETWALEERLREAALQRETELRAYTARLKELEAARLAQKSSATEDLEQVVGRFGGEISAYENRIRELEEALRGVGTSRSTGNFAGRPPQGRRDPPAPAPTARANRTTSERPVWKKSRRRRYSPKRRSRTWRPGSRRREKRAAATPRR